MTRLRFALLLAALLAGCARTSLPPAPPATAAAPDRDGVPKVADRCPTAPGPDGACPLLDADGDGVTDRDDRCPDALEVRNGWQDDDGCADRLPIEIGPYIASLVVDGLPPGKTGLTPEARAAIDRYAATVLDGHPERHVQLRGFAEPGEAPTAPAREALARSRAEAVREHLRERWGVDPARTAIEVFSDGQPAARTEADRAKLRRVEVQGWTP